MEHNAADRQPSNDAAPAAERDTTVPTFTVDPSVDPRDVWMTATDVHDYLNYGRSQGYAFSGSPSFQAVAALPGRWRLADVRAFFDLKFQQAVNGLVLDTDADLRCEPPAGEVGPARPGRPSRARRSGQTTADAYPFVQSQRRSRPPGTSGTTKKENKR